MNRHPWQRPTAATQLAWAVCIAATCLLTASDAAFANPAIYERGDDPAVGFNLIAWYNNGANGVNDWQNAVQEIYDAGFREVSISPVRYVTLGTGVIATTSAKGPELSHITAGVARAKSLGMRVTLNPFVEPQNFSMWRGQYNPTAGSAEAIQFWGDYQNYMVAVANIAEQYHVDSMTVGTEYKALNGNSGHNGSWNNVINAVNNAYSGPLGYAANWDDYRNSNLTTAIWENPAIDFLGIDSYFTNLVTTTQADASGAFPNATFINQMTTAWNNKLDVDSPGDSLDGIMSFAAARKDPDGTGPLLPAGMPVVFTEAGYLPYNRTARTPQNETGAIDTDEQRMAFNGLLNSLDRRGNKLLAVDIWQWSMSGSGGSKWNIDPVAAGADQPNNVALGQYLSQFVQTATLPLAGDYNRDHVVDAADYIVWRDNMDKYVLQYSGADGNGDGIVNQADFNIWQANFGISAGSASGESLQVPEPSTQLLLGLFAYCACVARFGRASAVRT